jgi:GT2 family glycosyltransferase
MKGGTTLPLVSIIIPHNGGEDILFECLYSLMNVDYPDLEIIVVDNKSPDESINNIQNKFPKVVIIKSEINRGFAGGCNLGAEHAKGEYLLILNNDTTHEKNWIKPLIQRMESNKTISSIQPKIKNNEKRDYFDYAGACGGFMDKYCFPFARGRIFNTTEKDNGQYDDACRIFWASGTAFLTRKTIFSQLEGFDETFFAHMEEIDYHWKCQLLGHEVWAEPSSVIYHKGAVTLPVSSSRKTYLNYRNSLILLLTNYPAKTVIKLFFPRIMMEFLSFIKEIIFLRWNHALAIMRSWFWIIFHPNILFSRRKKLVKNDGNELIYRGSIVVKYFLLNKKTYNKL